MTRIYITDGYLRDAVDHALRQAAESLESPKCQTLLTEFSDQQGRPLTKRLADLKMSLAEYVVAIIVEDGEKYARCREEGTLAFTVVGSRVIHVCGRAFARAAQRDAEEGKAILVHEVLHSLGLGENPPSSRRITYRVKELCRTMSQLRKSSRTPSHTISPCAPQRADSPRRLISVCELKWATDPR